MDATSQDQNTPHNGLEHNLDGTEMSNDECEKLAIDSKCHQLKHIEDGLSAIHVALEVTISKRRVECSGSWPHK